MAKKKATQDHMAIRARPTKSLFIDMLTRDIGLVPAIIDLVDNSTDGAQRIKGDKKRLDGLWVKVNLDGSEFAIADNCGGIDVETARKYAFRFGRPSDAGFVAHSVGQFGVGMKRALFKIGKMIRIESKTTVSSFVVEIDVERWESDDEDWDFRFSQLSESDKRPSDECGTVITVTKMRPSVADEFALTSFQNDLSSEIQRRIQHPLGRGIAISVNTIPVDIDPLTFLGHQKLRPAYWEHSYKSPGEKALKVKLFCGLGNTVDREQAGWSVFCNGRLILGGDKSRVTGWGERTGEIKLPGFHGQYNAFRGYAFFDCDDSGRLPWNTTKTGINEDSDVWRAVRQQMMTLAQPVKAFLDALKNEKEEQEEGDDAGPLGELLEKAVEKPMEDISTRKAFSIPSAKAKSPGPRMGSIAFKRPVDEINRVKDALGVSTNKEVGEGAFEYFLDAECSE